MKKQARLKGCDKCSYLENMPGYEPVRFPMGDFFNYGREICCLACGEHWWCTPPTGVERPGVERHGARYVPDWSI